MSIFEAILQGIVQGFTEFLPVSSSGHLSLFQHFAGLDSETGLLFSLILHLGTLVAIFVVYYKLICQLIGEFCRLVKDIFTGKFRWKERNPQRNMIFMLLVALIPLPFFYFLLGDFYKFAASDHDIMMEGACFMFTAFLLFLADRYDKGKKTMGQITPKDAIMVGVFQSIAPMPGVSRSGSTIASSLLRGFNKETAVAFSFVLGIPTILGGSVMELKDITPQDLQLPVHIILIGLITSAVVGVLSIKMVQWLIRTDKFKIFAYYTLALGILVVLCGMIEMISGCTIPVLLGFAS